MIFDKYSFLYILINNKKFDKIENLYNNRFIY